jgi:hypothetical protein
MRRDVHDVVAERPKGGRTWVSKTPRKKQIVLDLGGEQIDESSNDPRRQHQKHRTFSLGVLQRFLVRNLGRPWNKVYSEACDSADARSPAGYEIRKYLRSFVATECKLVGRKVMGHDQQGRPGEVRGLYVHPKTGLLMRTAERPSAVKPRRHWK